MKAIFAIILMGALAAAACSGARAPVATRPAPALAGDVCAQCHGANGMASSADIPNLAGQHREYLARQLRAFRDRTRSDALAVQNMWKKGHDLTDAAIDELAAWYSMQTPRRQPVLGSPAQIAAGERIFYGAARHADVAPCAGCHGNDGVGKTMFPRVAGQHMRYLARQLAVFQRSEQRPDGEVMMSVSHALSEDAIGDVAAFMQSLPGGAVE